MCNHVNSVHSHQLCQHTITNFCISDSFSPTIFSSPSHHVFNAITQVVEHAFYTQAKGIPEWETAMANELQALHDNHT